MNYWIRYLQYIYLFLISKSILCYSLYISSYSLKQQNSYTKLPTNLKTPKVRQPVKLNVRNMPSDLSFDDTLLSNTDMITKPLLLPNTDIQSLDGGANLGIILWTYVLFNGLFTTSGKPSDWILTPIAKLTNQTWKSWYQDYIQGFSYSVPWEVDVIRLSFFTSLSYLCNQAILYAFDGDVYWCWAIGFCLAIPCGLITMSRDKLPTREYNTIETQVKKYFSEFAEKRLDRVKGKKCDESRIILAFQQQWAKQRRMRDLDRIDSNESDSIDKETEEFEQLLSQNEAITEKILKKVIRQWVGYRVNREGLYVGIELLDRRKAVEVISESKDVPTT